MVSQTIEPMTPSRFRLAPQTPVLLDEDCRRAVHSGGSRKCAGHDATRLPCRFERAPFDFAPQWMEQLLSGLRDAAADDDNFRVEDVQEARHRRAEQRCGFA